MSSLVKARARYTSRAASAAKRPRSSTSTYDATDYTFLAVLARSLDQPDFLKALTRFSGGATSLKLQ